MNRQNKEEPKKYTCKHMYICITCICTYIQVHVHECENEQFVCWVRRRRHRCQRQLLWHFLLLHSCACVCVPLCYAHLVSKLLLRSSDGTARRRSNFWPPPVSAYTHAYIPYMRAHRRHTHRHVCMHFGRLLTVFLPANMRKR